MIVKMKFFMTMGQIVVINYYVGYNRNLAFFMSMRICFLSIVVYDYNREILF